MNRYEKGFITKCAEYGIDGRQLLEKMAQNSISKDNVIRLVTDRTPSIANRVPNYNFKNNSMGLANRATYQMPQRVPHIDMDGFFQFTDKVIKNPLLNAFKYQWRRFKNNTNRSIEKNRSPYHF